MPLHKETLVSIVTDTEITQSSVSLVDKRPRGGSDRVVPITGASWCSASSSRCSTIASTRSRGAPDAKFLGAGMFGGGAEQGRRDGVARRERAGRQDPGGPRAPSRSRRSGPASSASAPAELDRAKKWMAAFYERAYTERDKTESGSFAQEYLNHFLEEEPSPGIEYEYKLVQQLLPGYRRRKSPRSARRSSPTTAGSSSPRRRRRPTSRCRPKTS